eukprot:NODE_5931_length_542_cov_52.332657_g5184_i0.p1 GENE.NODE_5931_length_542_cov_52.332657_g5184_i0~~NODE_5931_length_542_cov_52.332657_g5184_i0.p1  ORF type:complete len:149 (+),score=37.32 NODE_5931_length_542_cov_52.332657_g5184_i0:26-448(+)
MGKQSLILLVSAIAGLIAGLKRSVVLVMRFTEKVAFVRSHSKKRASPDASRWARTKEGLQELFRPTDMDPYETIYKPIDMPVFPPPPEASPVATSPSLPYTVRNPLSLLNPSQPMATIEPPNLPLKGTQAPVKLSSVIVE